MNRIHWLVPVLALALAGCQSAEAPAAGDAPADDALPIEILVALQKDYTSPDMETRYFQATTDLNDDGQPERIVHLIGPMACGTGGCPTLVFTPAGVGHRLVSTISVSRPPIRASADRSSGWRNLIVSVAGGGGASGNAVLEFDGTSYPANPTVAPARIIDDVSGAEVLIADFEEFSSGTLLPAVTVAPAPGAGS